MLKLRRGEVIQRDPLVVRVAGQERPAWADPALVGEVLEGDRVILNVDARDLGLGSGGFDVVHVNLTRGLDARGRGEVGAMKLNYTSLQHPVDPVEIVQGGEGRAITRRIPVLVILLHGQLAPAAWAGGRAPPELRAGFIQTPGGALPGGLSNDLWVRPAPVDEYAQSGLPGTTMGREIADDRLFFATALAAGDGLAATAAGVGSPG